MTSGSTRTTSGATAKGVKLTWQAGASGRVGRWKKLYRGTWLYYSAGQGRDDAEALREAVAAFVLDAAAIDRGEVPPSKRPRTVERHVLAGGEWTQQTAKLTAVEVERRDEVRKLLDNARSFDPPAAAPVTVRQAVEAYLARKRADMRSGGFKPTSLATVDRYLRRIVAFCGNEPTASLTGAKLDDFRTSLLEAVADDTVRFSVATAQNTMVATIGWVRWCYETERLDTLPRNLNRLGIKRALNKPKTFTPDEVRRTISCASDRNRLYLLLMANCGMYGADIACIRPEEVDWERGRITRKRTKTEGRSSTPTTSYLLWDETLELLRQFRSDDPERVIVSESGGPLWVQIERDDNGITRRDLISQAIKRHFKREDMAGLALGRSAKNLRKTGATLLKDHPEFFDLADVYLSHAPMTVADRHYAEAPVARLDKAVRWLGSQFGFETSR